VELALSTLALTKAMQAADPTLDMGEIEVLADRMEAVANSVATDLQTTQQRRARCAKHLRRAVGLAVAMPDSEAKHILSKYPWPEHWSLEPTPPDLSPDTHLRALAVKYLHLEEVGMDKARNARKREAEAALRQQVAEIWENAK
jgi:hypothetical protein